MNRDKARIEQVMAFMDRHYDQKISLDDLAAVAHFSKYHFSRTFSAIVGQSPLSYLTNKRLEQAIAYLLESDKSITEISALCGFESASNFNVAFKKKYNRTPSEIRKQDNRNISKVVGKDPKDARPPLRYDHHANNFLRRIWEMNISIRELEELEVAYVRHVGSYLETYKAWGQLGEWCGKHQFFPPKHMFIGISLDDPASTEESECRYDACVTVPDGFTKDDDSAVRYKTLPGGQYALYHFYDTIDKLGIAYQTIFGQWLPHSDYEPDDRHCLEFCMNNPAEDPEGKAKVDLYIPVKARL